MEVIDEEMLEKLPNSHKIFYKLCQEAGIIAKNNGGKKENMKSYKQW